MTAGGDRHRGHRADHGARLGHAAAGVSRPRRTADQPASVRGAARAARAPRPARGGGAGAARVAARRARTRSAVTLLLLALAAPVLALRVGNPDEGSLPETRTERRAYDLVAAGFGPGINGPLVIAVDISTDASVVEPLRARGRRRPRHRRRRRPARSTPRPASRRSSAYPDDRTAGRRDARHDRAAAQRRAPAGARREPGAGPRRRPDRDLRRRQRPGQATGCRCSSPP